MDGLDLEKGLALRIQKLGNGLLGLRLHLLLAFGLELSQKQVFSILEELQIAIRADACGTILLRIGLHDGTCCIRICCIICGGRTERLILSSASSRCSRSFCCISDNIIVVVVVCGIVLLCELLDGRCWYAIELLHLHLESGGVRQIFLNGVD